MKMINKKAIINPSMTGNLRQEKKNLSCAEEFYNRAVETERIKITRLHTAAVRSLDPVPQPQGTIGEQG